MTATLEPLSSHAHRDTQWCPAAEAPAPEPTKLSATPMSTPPARVPSLPAPAKARSDPMSDAPVLAEPNVPTPANIESTPKLCAPGSALSDSQRAQAKRVAAPMACPPVLADPFLALAADVLDDLESVRVGNENRLRQLTRTEEDSDGEERGFGLTLDHPDVARLAALVDALASAEHQAALNLARLVRKHPLGPWIKQARGVGEKQGARLLAAIGDPYINTLHDRPRTVSELWAYCGLHVLPADHGCHDTQRTVVGGGPTGSHPDQGGLDTQRENVGVAARRVKGQKANWSDTAKKRAWLVATSCMKTSGPYRDIYEQARAKYTDTVHPAECKRCGPKGKPALVGSPRSAGHQHAMALRLVSKAVLKDLWRGAKRLHEQQQT